MSLETDKDLLDEQAERIQKLEAEIERLQRQLGEATARIETDGREIERLRAVLQEIIRIRDHESDGVENMRPALIARKSLAETARHEQSSVK